MMRSCWITATPEGQGRSCSLRTFLLCTTLIGAWCGWRLRDARETEAAIEVVQISGAEVACWRDRAPAPPRLSYASTTASRDVFSLFFRRPEVVTVDFRGLTVQAGIWIERATITDAKLAELWPVLARIDGLNDLNLSSNPITSVGLREIAILESLEYLHLFGTQVDDLALVHLESLDSLEFVDVHATNVTLDGVARLKEKLPHCIVLCDLKPTETPAVDEGLVLTAP